MSFSNLPIEVQLNIAQRLREHERKPLQEIYPDVKYLLPQEEKIYDRFLSFELFHNNIIYNTIKSLELDEPISKIECKDGICSVTTIRKVSTRIGSFDRSGQGSIYRMDVMTVPLPSGLRELVINANMDRTTTRITGLPTTLIYLDLRNYQYFLSKEFFPTGLRELLLETPAGQLDEGKFPDSLQKLTLIDYRFYFFHTVFPANLSKLVLHVSSETAKINPTIGINLPRQLTELNITLTNKVGEDEFTVNVNISDLPSHLTKLTMGGFHASKLNFSDYQGHLKTLRLDGVQGNQRLIRYPSDLNKLVISANKINIEALPPVKILKMIDVTQIKEINSRAYFPDTMTELHLSGLFPQMINTLIRTR